MQTHGLRIAAIIAALVVRAGAAPLAADTILVIVTSGSPFTFSPSNGSSVLPFQRILLAGTNGFTLNAGPQFGATGPRFFLEPGTTSSFFARWIDNDLPGTATLLGETYTGLGNPNGPNHANIEYQSSMFSLPSTGGTSLTVTAPFTLNGILRGRSPPAGT